MGFPVCGWRGHGEVLDQLSPIGPGKTAACSAPGVGKSDARERARVAELLVTRRADATIASATTATAARRSLGDSGCCSTPRERELQLWADVESLDSTFANRRSAAHALRRLLDESDPLRDPGALADESRPRP